MLNRLQNYRRGFTLIELMICVAIIGILAAVGIPSFRKYLFDSKESEGTAMLLSVCKDEARVRMESMTRDYMASYQDNYTDAFQSTDSSVPVLLYRPGSQPRFNVIVGESPTSPGVSLSSGVNARSFVDLGFQFPQMYPHGASDVPNFGPWKDPGGNNHMLVGAEAVLMNDGYYDVLATDENCNLLKICDEWTQSANPLAQATYQANMGGAQLRCGVPSGTTGGSD